MYVNILSQKLHPSPHLFDFWKKYILKFLVCAQFVRSTTHTLATDASSPHVCTDEWLPTASTLCPLSLSRKKAQAVSPSYAQKSKAQMDHPLHVSCYSARLAEERRKKETNKQTRR